ncbi:MAG: electron transport complex subunit RsxC [Candidatus Brocadiales bacterium]
MATGEKGLKSFQGGIHPPFDGKSLSKDKEIIQAPLPDVAQLYMSQHIGAPAKVVVAKGDAVKKGQKIGEAPSLISANVHASISGKVTDITFKPHPVTGARVQVVVIQREGEDTWAPGLDEPQNVEAMSPDDIRNLIKEAGIVGLGGATFPTHVKLSPPKDKSVDAVILNGAECEPYLTCDYRLLMEKTREVIEGLRIIMKCLGCKNGYVGIEANKMDAYERVREAVGHDTRIKVELLEVKYPQGAEHQLVKAILGREFKPTQLPIEAGAVVHNVSTTYAVYEAVKHKRPLIERVVSITGDGVENPTNLLLRVGSPIEPLIKAAGLKPEANKIIYGGPMMGIAQPSVAEAVTIKGTGGILVMSQAGEWQSHACIRCGKCIEACPYGLNPSHLSILCESEHFQQAMEFNLMECKECGCCTYVCTSRRPIVHLIKTAKYELGRQKVRAQEAQKAKEAQKAQAAAAPATAK